MPDDEEYDPEGGEVEAVIETGYAAYPLNLLGLVGVGLGTVGAVMEVLSHGAHRLADEFFCAANHRLAAREVDDHARRAREELRDL